KGDNTLFTAGLGLFSNPGSTPTGLQTLDGTSIVGLRAKVSSGILHSLINAPKDLNDYFATLNGDYTVTGVLDIFTSDPGSMSLNLTNASISPIPEPSTYAAILGVGALGLGFWRRRKIQKNRTLLP